MLYRFYNLILTVCFVLLLPFLPVLWLSGRRFRRGFLQRLGFYPREILESLRVSRPIWIHAVSVGEVLVAKHLAGQLKRSFPGKKILLSTFTAAGNDVARQSVPEAAGFIFLPLDHPWIVRRALVAWKPSILIFLETEIWPNLLQLAYRRGIPTLMLSGRLSPGSYRYYLFFRPLFSRVVQRFTAMGMQSDEDAERMIRLGADPRRISVTGNLKHAFGATSVTREKGKTPRDLFAQENGGRRVLVAGSTHRGEEEILLDAFLSLKASFPELVMILAPRHPQRFAEVEKLLRKKQVSFGRRSRMNGDGEEVPDVVFLDTVGELAGFYSVADIAFVGGSLVDAGGHNLMEPARYRKPVLFGPYMTNFAHIAGEMKRAGGGIEIHGKEDLIREASRLLTDRAGAERVGEFAYRVVEGDRGVVERSMDLVSRYL